MGSLNKQNTSEKEKDVKTVSSDKAQMPKVKFTVVTKEELERRRIPVYSYIL
jgi:hypothetical protein